MKNKILRKIHENWRIVKCKKIKKRINIKPNGGEKDREKECVSV